MPVALVFDPFGLAAHLDTLAKAFDPDQPRDDHGRWTSGGNDGITGLISGSFAARSVIAAGITNGGFTYHPGSNTFPGTGYAVAIQGHNREIPFTDGRVKAQRADLARALVQYVKDNKQFFRDNPNVHLGGWRDRKNGEFVFDLTEVVHDQAAAITLGQDRNQQAIFDLSTLTEIPTGGTGDREVNKQAHPGPTADLDPGRRRGLGAVGRGVPEHGPGADRGRDGLSFDPFGIGELVAIYKDWDESKHPRDANGRFGSGDGTSSRGPSEPALHNVATQRVYPTDMSWYAQTLAGHQGESYQYRANVDLLREHGQEGKILAAGIGNWTGSSTSLKEAGFTALQNPDAPISGASPEMPQELKNWEGASFGQGVIDGYGFTADQMKGWGYASSTTSTGTIWSKEDRPIDNPYDGQARAMMQAAADGPSTTEDTYRGRGINSQDPEGAADLARYTTEGNSFDYSLVSFTTSKDTAENFSSGKGDTQLVLHVEPGANGLDISGASSFDSEHEVILSGRFQVASVERSDADSVYQHDRYDVTLTPLGPPGVGADFHAGDVALPQGQRDALEAKAAFDDQVPTDSEVKYYNDHGSWPASSNLKNEDGTYKIFDGISTNQGGPDAYSSFTPKDLPSAAFMSSAEVNKLPEDQSSLALPALSGDKWYLPTSPKDLADYGQIPKIATSYADKQGWTDGQMIDAGYVENPQDPQQWIVPDSNSYPMGDAPVPAYDSMFPKGTVSSDAAVAAYKDMPQSATGTPINDFHIAAANTGWTYNGAGSSGAMGYVTPNGYVIPASTIQGMLKAGYQLNDQQWTKVGAPPVPVDAGPF